MGTGFRLAHCSTFLAAGHGSLQSPKPTSPKTKLDTWNGRGLLWDAVRKEQALGRLPESQVHSDGEPEPGGRPAGVSSEGARHWGRKKPSFLRGEKRKEERS